MNRPHRLVLWVIAAVMVAIVVLITARPAAAEPSEPPITTTTTTTCETAPTAGVVPDDCWGRFPSSHYDIGCDEGAWNSVGRKVYCLLTDLAYQGARVATASSLWLIQWAFGFDVFDRLGLIATDLADALNHNLVGPLDLARLAWFYAAAWAGLHALRGRLTTAAGELALSIVLAVAAGFVLANPAGYLHGLADTVNGASAAVLAAGTDQQPPSDAPDTETVIEPVQASLHRAFVEEPYDYLNWGQQLTGACATARDRILIDGPHGGDDEPRQIMRDAGCEPQADFNHDPNSSRLFGAILTFVAAVAAVVLLGFVAMTVIVAKVFTLVLWGLAPLALLGGLLPGAGRELLWRWTTSLLRAALAVIGMSFLLALLLLAMTSVLARTAEVGLVERFALLDAVVAAMFVARKRIMTAGHGWASSLGQHLASRRAGGGREVPWLAAPAVAGVTGFALGAAVGADRPTHTGRMAGTVSRNTLANRRVRRQGRAADRRAERRSSQTVARERTEIRAGADGEPQARTLVSVDGPVPRSRRARRARDRVEHHAGTAHARHAGGWVIAADVDEPTPMRFEPPDDEPLDVEDA